MFCLLRGLKPRVFGLPGPTADDALDPTKPCSSKGVGNLVHAVSSASTKWGKSLSAHLFFRHWIDDSQEFARQGDDRLLVPRRLFNLLIISVLIEAVALHNQGALNQRSSSEFIAPRLVMRPLRSVSFELDTRGTIPK